MGDLMETAADVHAIIQRELVCKPCREGQHGDCEAKAEFLPTKEEAGCHCGFFNTEKEARTIMDPRDLPPIGTKCARSGDDHG